MKKIISVILALLMLFATLSITVSAIENPLPAYRVKWSALSCKGYWYDEEKDDSDFNQHFKAETSDNSITFKSAKADNERRAYVSTKRIEISDKTKYEYVFQVKCNRKSGSCGVVFAFANNLPYFIYGVFANEKSGKAEINVNKGVESHNSKDCSTGFEKTSMEVFVDADGYSTFKVVYNGYDVSFYALTDSIQKKYEMVGKSITLPSDAKIAFGAYNAANSSSKSTRENTANIKNAVLYAANDDAYTILKSNATGGIVKLAKPNYTTLQKWIDKSEKLDGTQYNEIAYTMLMQAVERAQKLIKDKYTLQTDVDEMLAIIEYRYHEIIPESQDVEETESATSAATEDSGAIASDTTNLEDEDEGCGSVVLGSSVLGISTLFVASACIIKKKKDD